MASPSKSEMDYETSEDELPLNADLNGAVNTRPVRAGSEPSVSFEIPIVSVLSERSSGQSEPPSPNRARKRSNDEIYRKSQLPILQSTTPLKTPPKSVSFHYHSSSDPQTPRPLFGSSFETVGSSNLRNVMNANSPEAPPRPPSERRPEVADSHQVTPAMSFVDEIETHQQALDAEFERFESGLEQRNKAADLSITDWDDMEKRYLDEMRPLLQQEDELRKALNEKLQQFLLWMQVSGEKEEERAIKRLRTRTAFVRGSESRLAEKGEHYRKVVEAFETAMRLLTVS